MASFYNLISIHAPPRGATRMRCASCKRTSFQFTPLREGRPNEMRKLQTNLISIHAPPRGATRHTARNSGYTSFQFTPLREGRPSARVHADFRRISIHAPPRGATGGSVGIFRLRSISIHAPPRGATAKDMQFLQIFCSTLTNQHGLTIVPGNLSRLFW